MRNGRPLLGCCGWSGSKEKYFAEFGGVELQSPFYELPSVELARKWRGEAPHAFEFCLKAWQLITHAPASPTYRRLKTKIGAHEHASFGYFRPSEQVMWAWERTAQIARELQARVVLFQCPASFRANAENLRHFRQFFATIEREEWKLAWEPRGDWPEEQVDGLCREFDLLRCVDPLGSGGGSQRVPYWRLHGKGSYSYRYTDDDLKALRDAAKAGTDEERPQYIFFNNVKMKEDALRFRRLCEIIPS